MDWFRGRVSEVGAEGASQEAANGPASGQEWNMPRAIAEARVQRTPLNPILTGQNVAPRSAKCDDGNTCRVLSFRAEASSPESRNLA